MEILQMTLKGNKRSQKSIFGLKRQKRTTDKFDKEILRLKNELIFKVLIFKIYCLD